jgi:predicted DsbA family dithiol-disulfide isomerase
MLANLKRVACELDLPFGDRRKTYNSRFAQELGKWAESLGKGNEFHDSAFRAYFAEGLNIADNATLLELGNRAGLPSDEVQSILDARPYRDAVDADWSRAYQLGITAVPTFRLNRQVLVGAQPYNVLVNFLDSNQVKRRTANQSQNNA